MCALRVCAGGRCPGYDIMPSNYHLGWNVFPFNLVKILSVYNSGGLSNLLHVFHDVTYLIDIGTRSNIADKIKIKHEIGW